MKIKDAKTFRFDERTVLDHRNVYVLEIHEPRGNLHHRLLADKFVRDKNHQGIWRRTFHSLNALIGYARVIGADFDLPDLELPHGLTILGLRQNKNLDLLSWDGGKDE